MEIGKEVKDYTSDIKISIVVPVFNEGDAVAQLHGEIHDVCKKISNNFEIIFVNDGSTDHTLEQLKRLKPISIVNFRRNFGQTAAIDAGIKVAQGEYIITMDGDGQNNPADIPKLIEKLESDKLDVVSGWRFNRHDRFVKRLSSKMAGWLRKCLINDGIHDSGCTLKIYKRNCFAGVDLTGEMHRFIPAILKIRGFKIGEIKVSHRSRTTGVTKYDWRRGIKGGLDILSVWFWQKYSNRPLHLFGGGGIFLILLSFIFGLVVMYRKIFLGLDLSDTILSELTIYMFLVGVQFVIFGLLTDFVSKTYYSTIKDKYYYIDNIIINESEDNNK